jgi:hypothetical protein
MITNVSPPTPPSPTWVYDNKFAYFLLKSGLFLNNLRHSCNWKVKRPLFSVVGEVSDRIGHDWRNLARELGACTETEIQRIEQSCSDHQSAARQALELFRTRNRHEDHVRRIATALKAIRRHNLAARVRELSRNHGHDIRF